MAEHDVKTSPVAARIDHSRDGERPYLISPENRDLFVRTGRQVIAACDTQLRIEGWLSVYEEMLRSVRDFAQDHADLVDRCYAVPEGAKTALRFVPKSRSFDFNLAGPLADLQFDFQKGFANLLGSIEVGQIPGWDVDRFIDSSAAQLIYPMPTAEPTVV